MAYREKRSCRLYLFDPSCVKLILSLESKSSILRWQVPEMFFGCLRQGGWSMWVRNLLIIGWMASCAVSAFGQNGSETVDGASGQWRRASDAPPRSSYTTPNGVIPVAHQADAIPAAVPVNSSGGGSLASSYSGISGGLASLPNEG
jgi:hypothetical protein